MPVSVPSWVVRLTIVWNNLGHPFWSRLYFLGNVTSSTDVYLVGTEFLGKFTDLLGPYELWRDILTTRVALQSIKYTFLRPQQGPTIDETGFFFGDQGRILGSSQAWHATCRINWFSLSSSPRPHWMQISPVPEFQPFLGIPRAEYLARVVTFADKLRSQFTTISGDVWQLAVRDHSGEFYPVVGSRVSLFDGRQKTRRRRV